MPKFDVAKGGKIVVAEEIVSSGDESSAANAAKPSSASTASKRKQRSKAPKEGSAEWEKVHVHSSSRSPLLKFTGNGFRFSKSEDRLILSLQIKYV